MVVSVYGGGVYELGSYYFCLVGRLCVGIICSFVIAMIHLYVTSDYS